MWYSRIVVRTFLHFKLIQIIMTDRNPFILNNFRRDKTPPKQYCSTKKTLTWNELAPDSKKIKTLNETVTSRITLADVGFILEKRSYTLVSLTVFEKNRNYGSQTSPELFFSQLQSESSLSKHSTIINTQNQ